MHQFMLDMCPYDINIIFNRNRTEPALNIIKQGDGLKLD